MRGVGLGCGSGERGGLEPQAWDGKAWVTLTRIAEDVWQFHFERVALKCLQTAQEAAEQAISSRLEIKSRVSERSSPEGGTERAGCGQAAGERGRLQDGSPRWRAAPGGWWPAGAMRVEREPLREEKPRCATSCQVTAGKTKPKGLQVASQWT